MRRRAYGPVENNTQGEEGQHNGHDTEGAGHAQGGASELLRLGKCHHGKGKPGLTNNVLSPVKY